MTQEPSEGPVALQPLFVVAAASTIVIAFLFLPIGGVIQIANLGFGLWFSSLFLFFGIPFICLRIAGYDALRTAGVSRPWITGAAFGLLVGVVNAIAVAMPLQYVSQRLAPKEWLEIFESGVFGKHQSLLELSAVVLGVCLAAPFCEEFCFRGLLQRGAATRLGNGRAIVLAAAIFSAFHMDPIGFLARFELGLVFGLLALRSGSIWPGAFAHLAHNALATGLYFGFRDSDGADDDLPWKVPLAMAGAGIPLLWGLVLLSKRWPMLLEPPWRAEERRLPAQVVPLVLRWSLSGLVAVAALLTLDPNGVRLNWFDAFNALKEPKKADGEKAQKQWDELWRQRQEAHAGKTALSVYETARREAIADRTLTKADAGSQAAGEPPDAGPADAVPRLRR